MTVAETAVQIQGDRCLVAFDIRGRIQIGNQSGVAADISLVLVLMVPEVRYAGLFLMPTVRRHGTPTELER